MFPLQTLRLYPFLKLAIALILGMWLATGVDILHSWQWALAFVAVTIITLFLRRPLLQSLLLLFSVFLLGGTLMTRQLESIGDGYAADETIFDAVVASQPVMKKKVMQMDLWITSASGQRHHWKNRPIMQNQHSIIAPICSDKAIAPRFFCTSRTGTYSVFPYSDFLCCNAPDWPFFNCASN